MILKRKRYQILFQIHIYFVLAHHLCFATFVNTEQNVEPIYVCEHEGFTGFVLRTSVSSINVKPDFFFVTNWSNFIKAVKSATVSGSQSCNNLKSQNTSLLVFTDFQKYHY